MKLTIKFDATHNVWFAHDGETENTSRYIGEGSNPEAACSDYWYQAHGDSAELVQTDDNIWSLVQGSWKVNFDSKQDAVDYANARDWQIKGRF